MSKKKGQPSGNQVNTSQARPAGLEPTTFGFVDRSSIQLRYGRSVKSIAQEPQARKRAAFRTASPLCGRRGLPRYPSKLGRPSRRSEVHPGCFGSSRSLQMGWPLDVAACRVSPASWDVQVVPKAHPDRGEPLLVARGMYTRVVIAPPFFLCLTCGRFNVIINAPDPPRPKSLSRTAYPHPHPQIRVSQRKARVVLTGRCDAEQHHESYERIHHSPSPVVNYGKHPCGSEPLGPVPWGQQSFWFRHDDMTREVMPTAGRTSVSH